MTAQRIVQGIVVVGLLGLSGLFATADAGVRDHSRAGLTSTRSTASVEGDWFAPYGSGEAGLGSPATGVASMRAAGCASGTTIHVEAGGSVQAAVDSAQPGDRIVVAAGVYNEAVVVATECLTLEGGYGHGAGWAVMDGTGLEIAPGDGTQAFRVQADRVTIKGFEMRSYSSQTGGWGTGVLAWNDAADHATVEGNWIHDMNASGVEFGSDLGYATSGWTVEGNRIENVGFVGVGCWGCSDSEVEDNQIATAFMGILIDQLALPASHDVEVEGNRIDDGSNAGIWVQSRTDAEFSTNIEVKDNEVSGGGGGIFMRRSTASKIQGNLIDGTGSFGILLNRASGNRVAENQITGAGARGIGLIINSNDNVVKENSVSGSGVEGIYLWRPVPFLPQPGSGNLIKENTVSVSGADGLALEGGGSDNVVKENHVSASASGCDLSTDGAGSGNCWKENSGSECPDPLPICD